MESSSRPTARVTAPVNHVGTSGETIPIRKFRMACLILFVLFSIPLFKLQLFALKSGLYSYIIIVPVISGYLLWTEKDRFYPSGPRVHAAWSVTLITFGCGLLLWAALLYFGAEKPARVDLLALSMYSFASFLGGAACHYLGRETLRVFAFPLAFLVFLAPFPEVVESGFETMLQHGSSWVAHRFFDIAQMPAYREGTYFQLPGFSMQVAPECSGLRSTLALFLTSLVAGQMFLRTPWKRVILAFVVVPIALVRNGFRVFVIGELCVQIGPHMIKSWIHRHGGPVFFALSLIPFTLVLFYLYKSDRRPAAPVTKTLL
jgi:exosortase C (VPDSG-CTERM-specific)